MSRKFDPANKKKLENSERKSFYDLHNLIRWFGISRGMTVADIGCGTGYCTVPMAAMVGERGKVYACDISEEMLDSVREKIKRWNIENIVPLLSEENIIPVDDESADFILLSLLVHEVESPGLFFDEMKRMLKRGGRVGIVDWEKVDSPCGPPLHERISLGDMKRLLKENGLAVEKEKMLGRFHYGVLAGRPEDLLRDKVEKTGAKLVQELLCIREKGMRGAVLAERLKRVRADSVVEILREMCNKAAEKRPRYVEVMESCLDVDRLRDALGMEKMSRIYSVAKGRGYSDVVRLLMNPPPKGKRYSEYDFVEGRDRHDITLGEKRSLAKGLNKDTLDRILYDEDPLVVKNLLANPRITERDVLKIASKRPVKSEVLKVIFESPKWSSRYIVKKALVLNPYTPTGIALGLVNFMQYKDLKLIASAGSLHEEIRSFARELLRKSCGEQTA